MRLYASEEEKTEQRTIDGQTYKLTPVMAAEWDWWFTDQNPFKAPQRTVVNHQVGEQWDTGRTWKTVIATTWVSVSTHMQRKFDATPL